MAAQLKQSVILVYLLVQNETYKCLHSQEEQTYNISYLKVNKKEALSA